MSFNMDGYEDVAARLERLHQHHPDARVQIDRPELIQLPDDTWRILVKATVWRTPTDPLPCTEWSAEPFPGRTPYTRYSEWENAATSALGRALRLVLPGKHTATRSEIAARHHADDQTPALTPDAVNAALGGITDRQQLRALWDQARNAGILHQPIPDTDHTVESALRQTAADLPLDPA